MKDIVNLSEDQEEESDFSCKFSEEIWFQTYKYHTDNSLKDTLSRVAKDLASIEDEPEQWIESFYDLLTDFKMVPGGRITSNAGTGLHGTSYLNCYVDGPSVKDKDSISGIFDALTRAALILKSEGGYGFCCNFIRPRGAFIHGVGVETPGAVEMLRLWDTTSDVITKGSGKKKKLNKGKNKIRKGAMMVTMGCWHPDIEEFITVKGKTGSLSKFNMSVLCTDDFMNAVKKNQPWSLLYPDTTYKLYKEKWDGNLYDWMDKGYPVVEYKKYKNANELWDLIMQSTYNRNEPGVLFIDRINYLNNLNYAEHIQATNPCVAEGTLVNTPYGYRRVEDIQVGDLISTVRGAEPVHEVEMHDDTDVYEVEFADGGKQIVTAAHRYHVRKVGSKDKMYYKLRVDELNSDYYVRVMPSEMVHGTDDDYDRGLAISDEKNFDIESVNSVEMAVGLLDGLIATDGNINLSSDHPQVPIFTLSIFTLSYELAQNIRRLFLAIGSHAKIHSSLKNDGGKHTIVVGTDSLKPFIDLSRLEKIHPEKGEKLSEIIDNWDLSGGAWKTKIKSIKPAGKSTVYDLYCQGSDTWITSGYTQMGCGEQLLPDNGVCLLGSINLTQFVNQDGTSWDYEKLSEYIPSFVRLLDNVNDVSNVPLPELDWNLKNKRRIGIGYVGYGSALYMMKVRYGSERALELTDKLCSFVTNKCYQASALLAKEKGAFPLYNEEKYLNSNFVKQALTEDTISLIREHGIRNSHLASIQPTGNTSVFINNVSSGLEPIVSPEYYRTVTVPVPPDGLSLPVVNWAEHSFVSDSDWKWAKEGDESIMVLNFNDTTYKFDRNRGLTKEQLVEDYAVRVLKENGEWDPDADWAVDIYNLSIKEHIDTLKTFAKYICSAISKTINIPNDYPYEDFKSLYMDMYDSGFIKGGTTYRMGTMTQVVSKESTTSSEDGITYHAAPKRPKELPCNVHHLTVGGEKWVCFVGLFKDKPYEVFAGLVENVDLNKKVKEGVLVKGAKGKYSFKDDSVEIKDINAAFNNATEGAVTRLVSMSLRHGVDTKFIITQLLKTGNGLNTFSKCLARTLKKYIKEGEHLPDITCDECGSKNVAMIEGCNKCLSCGFSACS